MRRVVYFVVFCAVVFGAYLSWYYYEDYVAGKEYETSIAPIRQAYKDTVEYNKLAEESIKKEKAMLIADTYGGETPEETLKLFVEALEAGDAKLASKYYMPWLQDEAEKEMREYVVGENSSDFLKTYKLNIITKKNFVSDIALYIKNAEDEKYPYRILFKQNSQTKLWKITEF